MSLLDRFRRKQSEERLTTIGKRPAAAASLPVQAAQKPKEDKQSEKTSAKTEAKIARPLASTAALNILRRPLVTEKSSRPGVNQYVFEVAPSANKQEVQRAIFELFGVKPIWVRIQNYQGNYVRYGRFSGQTKKWKKAIVGLKDGETIHLNQAS